MPLSGPRLRACPVLWGLIEECKKQKMELLTEKKSVYAKISSIREDARQQKANTNYG